MSALPGGRESQTPPFSLPQLQNRSTDPAVSACPVEAFGAQLQCEPSVASAKRRTRMSALPGGRESQTPPFSLPQLQNRSTDSAVSACPVEAFGVQRVRLRSASFGGTAFVRVLLGEDWRREGDSNPRYGFTRTTV